MDVTRLEKRAYFKIAVLRGRNAREFHSELVEAVENNALPYRTVARWAATFQRGRATSGDLERSGRPLRSDVSRAVIDQCMEYDRIWTLFELQAETSIEKRTILMFLMEDHQRSSRVTFILHDA
jgi:hypothetical protein